MNITITEGNTEAFPFLVSVTQFSDYSETLTLDVCAFSTLRAAREFVGSTYFDKELDIATRRGEWRAA